MDVVSYSGFLRVERTMDQEAAEYMVRRDATVSIVSVIVGRIVISSTA
jgi:hypothetical protein